MPYQCEINDLAERPTLAVRAVVPVHELPQAIGAAFGAVARYLGERGEQPAGPPFVAYHTMDMQALDVEAGFPVFAPVEVLGDIRAGEIPAGKYASCLHIGPYTELRAAYEALNRYVVERGLEATGIAYEFYLNDPEKTPPEELQTEILFPLKTT